MEDRKMERSKMKERKLEEGKMDCKKGEKDFKVEKMEGRYMERKPE